MPSGNKFVYYFTKLIFAVGPWLLLVALTIIDLVGDNKEFEVRGIFLAIIPIMGWLIVSEL